MSLFKNEVGRPTNEIKKKRKIIFLIFIVILILIISVISILLKNYIKDNSKNDIGENSKIIINTETDINIDYTVNTLGDEVNEKFKDVYAFNYDYYINGNGLTINAIDKNNKIINIVNLENNNNVKYENVYSVSYDKGKLYYNIGTEETYNHEYLYCIDLTTEKLEPKLLVSDGRVVENNIEIDSSLYDFYVHNNVLYYEDDATASINALDLLTMKKNEILKDEESISLIGVNIKNNKLFYHVYDGKIMEYDITTKQSSKILDGSSPKIYNDIIMYQKNDELYSYNIANGENKSIDKQYEYCIPTDNDYLCEKDENGLYLHNSGKKIGELNINTAFGFSFNGLLANNMVSINVLGDSKGTKIIDFNKKEIFDSESLGIVGADLYYINN